MTKDLFNRLRRVAISTPAVITDNTAIDTTSAPADVAGFESGMFEIDTGTISDADTIISVKVYEGNVSDGSDKAAVAAGDLQIDSRMAATPASGNQAAFDFSNDNQRLKLGYKGVKRYLGIVITPANNTGNIPISVSLLLGNPRVSAPSAS